MASQNIAETSAFIPGTRQRPRNCDVYTLWTSSSYNRVREHPLCPGRLESHTYISSILGLIFWIDKVVIVPKRLHVTVADYTTKFTKHDQSQEIDTIKPKQKTTGRTIRHSEALKPCIPNLVDGWDRIKHVHFYSLLGLSAHKHVKCYPTMPKKPQASCNKK